MNQLQKRVKQFCGENSMNADVESRFIDLSSELGELGKEILKSSDYGTKPFSKNEKYRRRLEKGSAGSEND